MRYKFGLVFYVVASSFTLFNLFCINDAATSSLSSSSPPSILNIKTTNYTVSNTNVTYVSSDAFYSKGMQPLYDVANTALDTVVGEEIIPEGYLEVVNGKLETGPKALNNEWGDLAKAYWGLLAIVGITVLLIVLMPIIGLCFCCCRCAGGRTEPFDKKRDGCRRVCCGFLLILVTSALIFGVVAAFVTNSYMQEGVENVTTTARHGTKDTMLYLQTTSRQIDHILIDNYNELSSNLNTILDDAGKNLLDQFSNESKAISLENLHSFVTKLPQIENELDFMKNLTNELRVKASQLNDGLRGVKRELLKSLTACRAPECSDILEKYQIGKLDINDIDYNKLPDEMLTTVLADVNELTTSGTLSSISTGESVLGNLKGKLEDAIINNKPPVKKAIVDAGDALKDVNREITQALQYVENAIGNNTDSLDTADRYIKDYSMYRFWVGIGISSLLLLIVLCLIFGLLCGICGRRPSGYGDDCCNKGAGSNFLMCGVALIFLTFSILATICLILFGSGLIIRHGVCEPLRNPDDNFMFNNYIDKLVDLNDIVYENKNINLARNRQKSYGQPNIFVDRRSTEPFLLSELIVKCHNNKPIYQVLRLDNLVDLTKVLDYVETFGISDQLQILIKSVTIDESTEILTEDMRETIARLIRSDLNSFSSDKFKENLPDAVTTHNLKEIATKLRETSLRIGDKPAMSSIKNSLEVQALHLETYQDKLVDPMIASSQKLLELSGNLEQTLRFNSHSFEGAMQEMLKEIEDAQDYIKNGGSEKVQILATELIGGFETEIRDYLQLVVNRIQDDIGNCQPLSMVYKSFLVAGCNRVIDPLNGFWTGLGWCILLFLVTIILCAKLSTLYQKSDPYPGPLVEAEYMYDAYSERDNIPLANGPKNKRRNKKYERRRNSRDRRGDYYEESNSPHGAISSGPPRDTRYNDMAPKHWEGGPPRYSSPPIAPPPDPEYERPPPYYYPGASPTQG